MSRRSALVLTVVVGGLGFAAGRVFSDDAAGKPGKEEMMKMMEEMARPAPEHAKLALEAGAWDADVTCWMDPSEPPTKSKGVSTTKSVLNGLYLHQDFKGDFMGKPFEGGGLFGYSKEKQRYFGQWASSMGTTPEIVWGTADATGNVVTFDGEPTPCPMGTYTPRWIWRLQDADTSVFEHWMKKEGESDYVKGMEIKYTRKR